jgi:hypothetical protein
MRASAIHGRRLFQSLCRADIIVGWTDTRADIGAKAWKRSCNRSAILPMARLSPMTGDLTPMVACMKRASGRGDATVRNAEHLRSSPAKGQEKVRFAGPFTRSAGNAQDRSDRVGPPAGVGENGNPASEYSGGRTQHMRAFLSKRPEKGGIISAGWLALSPDPPQSIPTRYARRT